LQIPEPPLDGRDDIFSSVYNGVDLIIVPGSVFDEKCHRCGHGKGYYDRFLKRLKKVRAAHGLDLVCMGVCLRPQLIGLPVPCDEYDVQLDAVATPDKIIWLDKTKNNPFS